MREAFGATFRAPEGYLNTPTCGVPPTFTKEALDDVHDRWELGVIQGPDFDDPVQRARAGFASLAGVDPATVAMGGSVSAVLAPVAAAVPDGSRVLVAEGEFTSVTFPFAAQAERGVQVIEAPLHRIPERAAEVDVVAVATVQSADGAVLDLDALQEATAGCDTLVVLDGTQQLGWLRLDLGWADVVAGTSYKWLLGPRGIAWAAYSQRIIDTLTPHTANWYAGERPWESIYGLPLRLAADARRFDTSPAWFVALGAAASLDWLSQLDHDAVAAHCVGLATRLRQELGLPQADSAIVSVPGGDPGRLEAAGIRAAVRAGAVRVGFHLYNTEDDLDQLLDALR